MVNIFLKNFSIEILFNLIIYDHNHINDYYKNDDLNDRLPDSKNDRIEFDILKLWIESATIRLVLYFSPFTINVNVSSYLSSGTCKIDFSWSLTRNSCFLFCIMNIFEFFSICLNKKLCILNFFFNFFQYLNT